MRILITNHHLKTFAGSETYTFALATALQQRGHEIAILTAEKGPVAEKLAAEGIPVALSPQELEGDFDIIHAHHNAMAIVARHFYPQVPLLFVSHGVAPGFEEPPSVDLHISEHVGVSEEVVDYLAETHGIVDARLIRNGVDTDRFAPGHPISEQLKSILVISNRITQETLNPLLHAAQAVGARVEHIGLGGESIWETEAAINRADLVVSLGRGALEAMACGRAVLIYDIHGCDGLITAESYPEIRRHNFSGRRYAEKPDALLLRRLLEDYSAEMGGVNRRLAEEHHTIEAMAERFEELYTGAVAAGVPGEAGGVGGREILYYQQFWRDRSHFEGLAHQLHGENQKLRAQLQDLNQKVQQVMKRLR